MERKVLDDGLQVARTFKEHNGLNIFKWHDMVHLTVTS